MGYKIFVFIVIICVVVGYIILNNKLNKAMIKVDEASSDIDVALAKRYDVLTKMIEVVKSYTKHEEKIIFEVIKLRNNMSMDEKNNENKKMDACLNKINVVVENYPKLKSNQNYKLLQQSILDVEEHLQAARRLYNSNVSIYNQMLATFPTDLISKSRGMVKRDFFESDILSKDNVGID